MNKPKFLRTWERAIPDEDQHADVDLKVTSPLHGAAILCALFNSHAVPFWAAGSAVVWETFAAEPRPGQPDLGAIVGPEFAQAALDAVNAIGELARHAPAAAAALEAAGYVGDGRPWLAVATTQPGLARLHAVARDAHSRFAAKVGQFRAP